MNAIPQASQTSARVLDSERNPYPGWMASAPVISAVVTMAGTLRYERRLGAGPMQTAWSANVT
jgi:hypothetical protein